LIRLIAILALIGLAFAISTVCRIVRDGDADDGGKPDGMPCYPDDQPAIPDCAKDCPFAVVCTAVFVSATTHESSAFAPRMLLRDRFRTRGDAILSSLIGDPPPRPPKA